MEKLKYFKIVFESIPVYRKIVLLTNLNKTNVDFLFGCGFPVNDIESLVEELWRMLIEKNEEYLDFENNEKESIIVRIFSKYL